MKIHVVLVRTEHSANIGSTARAMANMGMNRLILLDAKCEVDASSRQLAAGAQEQLEHVDFYQNWDDFYAHEGDGLRIGLSRRGGRKRKVTDLRTQLSALSEPVAENIYLVFGPEADGLDSTDLAFMNFTCHLPVFGEFASYNLAQAVLLTLFIFRERFPPTLTPKQTTGKTEMAAQPFYFPDQLIKDWIESMGFDVGARRSSAYLTLRRLFLQNQPTGHELRVLEAILQQNIRKLREPGLIGLAPKELRDHFGDISS